MKRSREHDEGSDHEGYDQLQTNSTFDDPHSPAKLVELDPEAVSDEPDETTMICSLPPHSSRPITFRSYDEYEAHYSKEHSNRCLECRNNFPSEHLLNLHIEEIHDPLVQVKRENGEHTYSCFVEDCERKCMTHQKRRMHLIDKHMYPKNFFFAVTKKGIDGRRSLLIEHGHHRRRSSASVQLKDSRPKNSTVEEPKNSQIPKAEPKEENDQKDTEMAELTGAMSALQFVPNSVRFGRGGGRAGFAKK